MQKVLAAWFLLAVVCGSGGDLKLLGQQNPQNSDILVQRFTAVPEEALSKQQRDLVDYLLGTPSQGQTVACPVDEKNHVMLGPFIVHLARWKKNDDGTYSLESSQWHAFRLKETRDKKCSMREIVSKSTGQPMLYGDKLAWLVGINHFDEAVKKLDISITYKVSAVPAKAENAQSFGALLAAVTGAAVPQAKESPPSSRNYVVFHQVSGLEQLPFDFNISPSVTPQESPTSDARSASPKPAGSPKSKPSGTGNGQQSDSGAGAAVDCSAVTSTGCSFTRTLRSFDREWWDISLAMAIPGVREPKYSASNPAAPPSSTRHTDLYGMLDLYLGARWATKDSAVPHFLVGLPVTGQPFYRPFFGLAENVSGWTTLQRRGFLPFRLSLFFGFVDMRQQYATKNPDTTAGQPALVLRPGRVWKPMFGIELPLSALVSKIK